ncbi:glutathione-dependent formaldehyde-activating gfa [Colletotrichum sojae]|uniref:Glutathione-dependent formaldehyde-activating gfa n=1 Tax=Colletotrichum sojae TaxID=2175907 RepID=A0A8H6MQA5_9PEZI|nr:glutathione-dependent formaldehyde-activating gfa [Colletotrichum sojae]
MVTSRSMEINYDNQSVGVSDGHHESELELRVYRGNCHCGAFVYEIEVPEIKSVFECNCSICSKKAYIWLRLDSDMKIKVVKGTVGALTEYTFGPKKIRHKFCPTCATAIYSEMGAAGQIRFAVNVRAIQGVDIWALEKPQYPGASLHGGYVPPEHNGPLPPAIDGHKLYTGSCHCGAVTVALMSKPLDETFDELVAECNCSICMRNGYRWIYPPNEQVVLHASDPSCIGRYSFARHVLNKTFCQICGVCLTNEYNYLTPEERKALGALPARGFGDRMKTHHPVNLRVFHGVDLSKMRPPTLKDGANIVLPRYQGQ